MLLIFGCRLVPFRPLGKLPYHISALTLLGDVFCSRGIFVPPIPFFSRCCYYPGWALLPPVPPHSSRTNFSRVLILSLPE